MDNETKPARERLTLIRIFEELRGLGYQGSYDAVRRGSRVADSLPDRIIRSSVVLPLPAALAASDSV